VLCSLSQGFYGVPRQTSTVLQCTDDGSLAWKRSQIHEEFVDVFAFLFAVFAPSKQFILQS
ncbi:MAG: hypothetical protein VX273_02875, partial [Acidobacteriota bacterium]|nr:hypothetical protein [Acidobacteriota bacterium]